MLPERLKNRLILTRSVHDFLDFLQLRVPLGYEFPESYSEAIIFTTESPHFGLYLCIPFVYSAWDWLLTSQTVVCDGSRIVVISSFELPEQSPETIKMRVYFFYDYIIGSIFAPFGVELKSRHSTKTKFSFAELNQLSVYFRTLKLEIYGHRISLKFTLYFVGD